MLHGRFVDGIALNRAHFDERFLGFRIIVSYEVGAGKIELLGIALQNVC